MAEYRISFYKYPRLYSTQEHSMFCGVIDKNEDLANYISVGTFDRMTVEEIQIITRSRDISDSAQSWCGNYLSLLVFDVGESVYSMSRLLSKETGNIILNIGEDGKHRANFLALTKLDITDGVTLNKQKTGFSDAVSMLHKELQEDSILTELPLEFSLLGCFGLSDLCVFWVSENCGDIFKAVDRLQNIRIKDEANNEVSLFNNFSTTISLNRGHDPLRKENANVEAIVQMSFKHGLTPNLLKAIRKKFDTETFVISSTFGEHDMSIRGPAYCLLPLLEKPKDGEDDKVNFYWGSEWFREHLLQTYTQVDASTDLLQEMNPVILDDIGLYFKDQNISESDEWKIGKKYNDIHEETEGTGNNGKDGIISLLQQHFPTQAGIVDDFNLLCLDMRNFLFSTAKYYRRIECADLYLAACAMIRYVLNDEKIIEETKDKKRYVLEMMRLMTDYLQREQQSVCISLDTPLCQSKYSGHQDQITRAYNNYLRGITEFINTLHRDKKQPKLYPLISSSSSVQISCRQYQFTRESESDANKPEPINIIDYKLPNTVMTDLSFGLASILHETFHYVYPRKQEKRDICTGVIALCELMLKCLCRALVESFDFPRNGDTKIEDILFGEFYGDLRKAKIKDLLSSMMSLLEDAYKEQVEEDNEEPCETYRAFQQFIDGPNNNFDDFCYCLKKELFEQDNFYEECISSTVACFQGEYPFDIKGTKYVIDSTSFQRAEEWLTDKERAESIDQLLEYYWCPCESDILDQCKEIKADIGMLEITDMDLVDYLLLISENHLLINYDASSQSVMLDDGLSLRLYAALRYFQKKDCDIFCSNGFLKDSFAKTYESDFKDRYVVRFASHPIKKAVLKKRTSLNDEENKEIDALKKRETQATEFWKEFVCLLQSAAWKYACYYQLIDALIEQFKLNIPDQHPPIVKTTRELFENIRKAEKEITEHLIPENEDYKQFEDDYYRELLNTTTKFIFKMQEISLCEGASKSDGQNDDPDDSETDFPEIKCVGSDNKEILQSSALRAYHFKTKAECIGADILYFINRLQSAYKEKFPGKEARIWFRGERDETRTQIPYLYRKLKNCKNYLYPAFALADNLAEFKTYMDCAPESHLLSSYHVADYIAAMQHYETPTSFLDFTEDMMTALYFSLSDLINNDKKIHPEARSVILFCPELYNSILLDMVDQELPNYMQRNTFMDNHPGDRQCYKVFEALHKGNTIPNLSLPTADVQENFRSYLCGSFLQNDDLNIINQYSEGFHYTQLPIAIHTSQVNPRIQRQHGAFLAFNNYVNVNDSEGKYILDQYALLEIQKRYLEEMSKSGKSPLPFAYKLTFSEGEAKKIAKQLKAIGIDERYVYPELHVVGSTISKHLR